MAACRRRSGAPWLLTGAGGVLGLGLAATAPAGRALVLAGRQEPAAWSGLASFLRADLARPGALAAAVQELRPAAVLHAAGVTRVAACEKAPERAWRLNVLAVEELLEALPAGCRLVYVSTDQVFAGDRDRYREQDAPDPVHVYGRSKAAAEGRVLAAGGTVVRLPLLLGPAAAPDRRGADEALLAAFAAGEPPRLYTDEIRCPASAVLLAPWLWRLLAGGPGGVLHLAGADAVSRYELGLRVCAAAGVAARPSAIRAADQAGAALRPRRLVLDCDRSRRRMGFQAPDLAQSLARLTGHRPRSA